MKSLPRLRFAHLPTPLEEMPRLSVALKGPRLLVKRDDQTGLALGGNKTRKLEFLLAEAQATGARTLITAGAAQSNHCRQTAAAAARYGFACILVLTTPDAAAADAPASERPASERPATGNLLLDRLFGAELVWTKRANRDQALQDTYQASWKAQNRPYLIPYGGSSPTGAASYAYAMRELVEQAAQLGTMPDWVVFPSSSGGTQAGMAVGKRLFGYPGQVLGISIDEQKDVLQQRVADLATQTADFMGEKLSFGAEDIQVNADYLGGGYGVMGEVEKEAISLFARTEGLLLDPVYTGRAAAGLIGLIRQGFFPKDQTVLFWHTGGTPALFADLYEGKV